MLAFFQSWDADVLYWIHHNLRTPLVDAFMKGISTMGNYGIVMIALCFVFLIPKKTRKAALTAGLALALGAIAVNLFIKPLVVRPRPYVALEWLTPLVNMERDPNSFPSGHTQAAVSLAFAFLLCQKNKVLTFFLFAFAVLMGLSRLFVGVHYPTDVLCGALIGVLAAIAAAGLFRLLERKVSRDKLGFLYEKTT